MDSFVEEVLNPVYTMGKNWKANLKYRKLRYRIKSETNLKKRRKFTNQSLKVVSKNFQDLNFKKLFYVWYADDWIILLASSYANTKVVLSDVSKTLQRLGLILNMGKTYFD